MYTKLLGECVVAYRLSVIIPIYNVEQYIQECLDSIVNQTIGIDNIEVILVNDCSSDGSVKIAEQYARKYRSIKILHHSKNLGSGAARNTGLKNASSELIAFVDGDDFITLNTFEQALFNIDQTNSDIFIYEYEYYSSSNRVYPRNPSAQLFLVNQAIADIRKSPELIFATSVCNKVFKKVLIGDLIFSHSRIEDVMFSTLTTFHAKKIYISNQCKYYYRKREQSISKTDEYYSNKTSYMDHLKVNIAMQQLASQYPEYKELIDWFNARSLHPFTYNMLDKPYFSFKEKRQYFLNSKAIFYDINPDVIEKLEKSFSKQIVKLTRGHSFLFFYATSILTKIYNKTRKGLLKIYKFPKMLSLICCLVLSLFFRLSKKYRNLWLVCERGYDARDNGYSFFEYLRKNHPDINVLYLIDNSNPQDLKKIKSIGEFVRYGSFRHKLVFILARYLITAHRGTIEPWNYQQYRKYFGFLSEKQKYIFLQHGITKDDVSNVLGRDHTSFDLFITGAKPEYDYIKSTFGYKNHEVVYTGFARFDKFHTLCTKKKILCMPTWRKKLAWSVPENRKEKLFKQSEYYIRYQSLLNNEELINVLDDYGYELIFYLHPEMQQFIDYFSTTSDKIVIADEKDYDVQALLNESDLLITDYSSVFFDFGYIGKPVMYYQFDSNDFFATHYKRGYFSYDKDGFGPVYTKEYEVLNYLNYLMRMNNQLEDKYSERIKQFFPLRDRNNCERIYQSIIDLK